MQVKNLLGSLPKNIFDAFLILGAVAVLLIIFLPGYTHLQELRDKNRELEVRIKQLNIENALLQQEARRFENDPVYQEKIARERMGVVRKGEIPVKLVPETKK